MAFDCKKCERHTTKGKCYVRGTGSLKASIMLIGTAPSSRDAFVGKPFMGNDSKHLSDALAQVGLTREQVFTTNLVFCYGTEDKRHNLNPPTPQETEACWANVAKEIAYIKPKVIVLMGSQPVEFLLGAKTLGSTLLKTYDSLAFKGVEGFLSGEVKKTTKKGVKEEKPLNKPEQFKVVTSPAPSILNRDPSRMPEIVRALKMAKDISEGVVAEVHEYKYKYAFSEQEAYGLLTEVLGECKRVLPDDPVVLDLETSGFAWFKRKFNPWVAKTLSVAFCFREYEAYSISFRPMARSMRNLDLYKQIMEGPWAKAGHNIKFDQTFTRGEFGIKIANITDDSMIIAYHLDQSADIGLGKLSPIWRPDQGFYWETLEKKYLDKEDKGYESAPDDMLLEYGARDVDVTKTLLKVLKPKLYEWGAIAAYLNISMPHAEVLSDMEFTGVPLDVDMCLSLGKEYVKKAKLQEKEALDCVGMHPFWWKDKEWGEHGIDLTSFKPFNLSSPKQLSVLLFKTLGLKATRYNEKSKEPSTDEEALEAIKAGHPFVEKLLAYRKTTKMLSTYLGIEIRKDGTEGVKTTGTSLLAVVDENGRIHPSLNITGTETARLSSTRPNLQNTPKQKLFRDLFCAEEGKCFIDADYAALELRVAALMSGEPSMLKIFKEGVLDIHTSVASKMFNIPYENIEKDGVERSASKALSFGRLYGKGAKSVAEDLGVSLEEGEKWVTSWGEANPVLSKWIASNEDFVHKHGYVEYSKTRRRPLPGGMSKDQYMISEANRAATNSRVQGTGADCTSTAVIRVHKRLRGEGLDNVAKICLEIHDQIIVECPKEIEGRIAKIVEEEMSKQMDFLPNDVPLLAEVGWDEKLPDKTKIHHLGKKRLGDGMSH